MIVLINPNASTSMTASMRAEAQDQLGARALEAWTSTDGPPAIQGPEDGARAVPPMLDLVRKATRRGASGIIIGCFDDTGLAEARTIANCPVIGIGQAGYHLAAAVGTRFSVVTTLAVSIPILEANIHAYGLSPQLAKVRASGVPVLKVEEAAQTILDEITAAEAEDGIDAVVLGCGGMTGLLDDARSKTGLHIVDGVRAATSLLGALT